MATNMYLKFEGPAIAGGATALGHQGEIEMLSWSHGFVQPTSPTRSAGGSPLEQANHSNLTFTKYLDSATNELLKYCWAGKQIAKATISCLRSDGASDGSPVVYLTIEMEHVVISNYSISGGPGDVPVENVSLDYGIVRYNYLGQKQKTMTAAHNLESRTIT
jgi:type VI secretion system secreted protein Hcp